MEETRISQSAGEKVLQHAESGRRFACGEFVAHLAQGVFQDGQRPLAIEQVGAGVETATPIFKFYLGRNPPACEGQIMDQLAAPVEE